MRPISFRLAIGWATGPTLDASKTQELLYLLNTLADHNTRWLRANPQTPRLYNARVRYQMEADSEEWKDIPNILADRQGDCEDLSSARVAELRVLGVRAEPYLQWRDNPGTGARLYHALVWRESATAHLPPDPKNRRHLWPARKPDRSPDVGFIEDPSRVLGM